VALAILSVIAFLALIVWRFVFNGQQRRSAVREIGVPRQRDNSFLEQGLHILHLAGVALIPRNRFGNGSNGAIPIAPKDCAKMYLRRIIALTCATQMRNCYVLDVGATRFEVRYRYVRRLRDLTDPKCAYEETCFYSADKRMPKAEHIAAALLQLRNNPALFDRWAHRWGLAFKADGQVFTRAQ
jgi:hypothetical protein